MHERRFWRCLTYLLLGFIWLYVLIMSSESTLYSCLNFKELFARNRCGIYLSVRLRTKWLWVGILLQLLRFIFGDIFGPKKNDIFCPVFVFQKGLSIGMLKYILYFKNEGLSILWISRYNSILGLKNGFHNTVFYSCLQLDVTLFFKYAMYRYEIPEVNLGWNEYICFEFFDFWSLNFL